MLNFSLRRCAKPLSNLWANLRFFGVDAIPLWIFYQHKSKSGQSHGNGSKRKLMNLNRVESTSLDLVYTTPFGDEVIGLANWPVSLFSFYLPQFVIKSLDSWFYSKPWISSISANECIRMNQYNSITDEFVQRRLQFMQEWADLLMKVHRLGLKIWHTWSACVRCISNFKYPFRGTEPNICFRGLQF